MNESNPTRRDLLHGAAAAAAVAALPALAGADDKAVTKGHIKQSIVFWCFNTAGEKWDVEKTCSGRQVARLRLGRDRRAGRLADAQEARSGLRHRA